MSLPQPQPLASAGEFGPVPLGELEVLEPGDAGRAGVEHFIADVYARRFGARVSQFAPHLVGLRDAHSGAWVAAAGSGSRPVPPVPGALPGRP